MSYSRFSLTRQVDGDNSRVEMKLAADEDNDNNVRGNRAHAKRKRLNGLVCCGTIAVILFFLIGKCHLKLKCSLSPILGT